MEEAVAIFVAGLGGVFIGMALIYAAIRMTSLLIDRLKTKEEAK